MMMDFHTPCNYIPAQIGFAREDAFVHGTTSNSNSRMIDEGSHISDLLAKTECIGYPEEEAYFPKQEAVWRMVKHHDAMAGAHQG